MGILALAADERVAGVSFSADSLAVSLKDGRTITVPLAWFPRLLAATMDQRQNRKTVGGGYGIHWPDLDEDLSTEGAAPGRPGSALAGGVLNAGFAVTLLANSLVAIRRYDT